MPLSVTEPGPPASPAGDAALRLQGVGKSYGRHRALIDVNLSFARAQVAAVLGPNGAGKSTLLAILSTLSPPSTGEVRWGGEPLRRGSALRSLIGYVGHDPGVYGDLTAQENLSLFARLYGFAEPEARADELLAKVGLQEIRAGAPARSFSRGMQQRLALARALLPEPELLLFDEPGSALDPAGAAWLTSVIAEQRSAGRIVILVTHDLDAAAAVAEQVVVLRRGRVVFDDTRAGFTAGELRTLYEERTRG